MSANGTSDTVQATEQRSRPDSSLPDEWEIGRLDVEAYLSRIGYDSPLVPTADTLHALHRAHTAAIPFENLSVLLGHGVSLDLDRLQDKVLRHRRGGYCFEQNLLFAALLERAGFEVRRLVARVQPDKPGTRTHMVVNVTVDGREWLADVGFGSGLLEPVPLVDGATARQGGWTYGVEQRAGGEWRLRSLGPDGWSDLYAFTREPQRRVDYVVYNHYTSTYPSSPFVNQVVAIRNTPEIRYSLRGFDFVTRRPDGATETRYLAEHEVIDVLHDTFGIGLGPEAVARLRAWMGH